MGYVANLFISAERHKPMKAVEQVLAVADRGFEGCAHARQGSRRQILIVDCETLAEFGLPPGVVRENITTPGGRPNSANVSQSTIRSEEHTSELQSHLNLVCRLLLEKKKH